MRNGLAFRVVAAFCVGLVLTAGPGSAGVVAAHKDSFVPPTLLAAEQPAMDAVRAALLKLDADVTRLAALSQVPRADFENVQQQVAVIKREVPGALRAMVAAIAKLRTAGKWTVEFDTAVLDGARRSGNTQLIEAVTKAGGARPLLERAAASDASQIGLELDQIVAQLRPRTALQRLLEPLLGIPVHASWGRAGLFAMGLMVFACAISLACGPSLKSMFRD